MMQKIKHALKHKLINPAKTLWHKLVINGKILTGAGFNGKAPGLEGSKVIVSLTSFPERIDDLHYTLCSICAQSVRPQHVILNLARTEFPNGTAGFPFLLKRLLKKRVQVNWVDDLKSYKKLVPTLAEYPGEIIVTADDDVFYDKDWLKFLLEAWQKDPSAIHCHRARIINFNAVGDILPYAKWELLTVGGVKSFKIIPIGAGGILYPPGALSPLVKDRQKFMELSPHADDLWFWLMAVLNGTQVRVVENPMYRLQYTNEARSLGRTGALLLSNFNVNENGNDRQLAQLLGAFPAVREKITFDPGEYWEYRYKKGGNSGSGSYGRLAEFKASVINQLVKDEAIQTVIEFGTGDGNQLSLGEYPVFMGVDVSATIVQRLKERFGQDASKSFYMLSESGNLQAELSLSLDVIYHLVDDPSFNDYMERLFAAATRFVCIYSSNKDELHIQHVRHRKFSDWVGANAPGWQLYRHIPNPYPFQPKNPDTSFADFYIYQKKS